MRWLYWCFLGTATWAAAAERPLIFPQPQQMTLRQDGFLVDEQVPIVVPENAGAGDLALARQLIAELSDRYGMALHMTAVPALPHRRFILLGAASNTLVRQYLAESHAMPPAKDEAYMLRAGPDAVVVAGNDDAGAFYGLQSLRQLIQKDGPHTSIRGVQVEDWPHVPFRAIRLYLPGHENIAFFKRFLRDFMALYKFNRVIMEVNARCASTSTRN